MKLVKLTSLLLCVIFLFSACGNEKIPQSHLYTTDTELGSGAKTLTVKIVDQVNTCTFTIHTDVKTVGEALLEHDLIDGENGEFGMYIKTANGVRADYNLDHAYWAFLKNGEYMLSGVDSTEFEDGDSYELVYTKG